MINMILWRCPLCRSDDGMQAATPWLRRPTVTCETCGASWQVQRIPGQDYRLRVVAGPSAWVGMELPLAAWYARMKAGVTLVPRPVVVAGLADDEEIYARDHDVQLIVRQGTPLPAPGRDRNPPTSWPAGVPIKPLWTRIGQGTLYMTNHRLLWETPAGAYDWYWPQVHAMFTMQSLYGVLFGEVAYRFLPPHQRALKWLTYGARVAARLRQQTGQVMAVTYH